MKKWVIKRNSVYFFWGKTYLLQVEQLLSAAETQLSPQIQMISENHINKSTEDLNPRRSILNNGNEISNSQFSLDTLNYVDDTDNHSNTSATYQETT